MSLFTEKAPYTLFIKKSPSLLSHESVPCQIMPKSNLVLTRAGDTSLHPKWIKNSPVQNRSWDLFVSYYGKTPKKWQRDDILYTQYQGGKGDGIYDVFQKYPDLLDRYDYILMADDDFDMTAKQISRIFEIMRHYDLQIGQPSFSHSSYAVYFPQYHNPLFKIRYSNFAEAITTCLASSIWRQILPLYQDNPHAWYIDCFWARLCDDPQTQCAIIDEVQVTHTRPCTSSEFYQSVTRRTGMVKFKVLDYDYDLDKWGLTKTRFHKAILKNGKTIYGKWRILPHLIIGWLKIAYRVKASQMIANRSLHRCVRRAIENHITAKALLTNTKIMIYGRSKSLKWGYNPFKEQQKRRGRAR